MWFYWKATKSSCPHSISRIILALECQHKGSVYWLTSHSGKQWGPQIRLLAGKSDLEPQCNNKQCETDTLIKNRQQSPTMQNSSLNQRRSQREGASKNAHEQQDQQSNKTK